MADNGSRARRIAAPRSTGVGLANIRDRLAQAYGAAHGIVRRAERKGGFSVILEIPFDEADDRRHKEP